MSTTMEVVPGVKDIKNSTNETVDNQLRLAYPAIRSAFLPNETPIKYLVAKYFDDPSPYDENDLEVQMILNSSFVPIIQQQEMKYFAHGEPLPINGRYGKDISGNGEIIFGNGAFNERMDDRRGHRKELFAEETEERNVLVVDDEDAQFMGYDYFFKDEEDFLIGKFDDLPFWRGD